MAFDPKDPRSMKRAAMAGRWSEGWEVPAAFAAGGSRGRDVNTYGPPGQESVPIGSFEEGLELNRRQQAMRSASLQRPKYGPDALQEVGPMFMQNRYGPGMLNHVGPMGGGGMPATGVQGFGQMFRNSVAQSPFPGQTANGGGLGGLDGMEWAMLAATLAEAGGNLYAQHKAGKQKDREYEDEEERRKAGGRLFGKMFRERTGG